MLLLDMQTLPRDDLRDHEDFKSQRPSSVGYTVSLQQYKDTPCFQWWVSKTGIWHAYGEVMVHLERKMRDPWLGPK